MGRKVWLLLLLVVAWLAFVGSARAAATNEIRITQASLQAEGSAALSVPVPYKQYRPERSFVRMRLVASFEGNTTLAQTRSMLRLDTWADGGSIELNGVEIAEQPTTTADSVVRTLRPFVFVIPLGVLRAGRNELVMQWGSRTTLVLVPSMLIGERDVLQLRHERQLFWDHTLLQVSLVFAVVVALVTLGVWWLQRLRQAPIEYLLMGLSAMGWIVFNTAMLWSPVPALGFAWRQAGGIGGIGLFALCMWVCLARLGGWHSRWYEAVALFWGLLGPALMLGGHALTGATHMPQLEQLWVVGAAALGAVPLVILARSALRARTPRARLLLGFVGISVVLASMEAAAYIVGDPIGQRHVGAQILAPLWLATACAIVVQDFVGSLRQAQAQSAVLDRRLAEREAELALVYQNQHARERERATDDERARITQDMHDGLGSQLVSSLALAERGQLSAAQTAELLRGCIDDLRLAIDTLGEGQVDLGLVAGNLRFRMEPRLRAAGLKVHWDMSRLPTELGLPGSVVLPLLRVLQEALANAIKHAGASELLVRLACENVALTLEVADNGHGFDMAHHAPGKGLAGMQKRARGLGAELVMRSSAQGTQVVLTLPLPTAPTP